MPIVKTPIVKPLFAAALVLTAAPLAATDDARPAVAPAGDADTQYCMRIEAITGSYIEQIKCWTRAEWEDQGVDVDTDWPREGVRVIG